METRGLAARICYAFVMLDWVGSLRVREQATHRLVLGLSPMSRWFGLLVAILGGYGALVLWSLAPVAATIPAFVGAMGLVVATLDRRLVFDRSAGTVELTQGVLGLTTRTVVPLFHLRAVVVMAKPGSTPGTSRYVAYLDRRVGDSIFLEEARRCARLLKMAEAIADLAELRLEYDAASVG